MCYIAGDEEKMKDRKTRKSMNEEKAVSFSSPFLFPARKREAVTQCGTKGIYHPVSRKTQGAGIVKGWEDKRDCGWIPYAFT